MARSRGREDTPEQKRRKADYAKAWRLKNHERAILRERARYHRIGDRWRKEHREQVKARRRALYATNERTRTLDIQRTQSTYRRLRDTLFAGYGGKCACCGETERAFLELDHVNGGGKKHFASHKSPPNLYREVIAAGFPPIYRILCANCNRGRQRNGGVCPHQINAREEFIA